MSPWIIRITAHVRAPPPPLTLTAMRTDVEIQYVVKMDWLVVIGNNIFNFAHESAAVTSLSIRGHINWYRIRSYFN